MVETLEKSNGWMLTPGTIGSRSQRILSGLWHLLSPQYLGSAQLYFQAGFSQDGVEKPSPQSSISERETLSQYLIHLPGALMLRPPVSSPQWCEEVAPGIQGMRRADFQREELTFSGKMNVYVCVCQLDLVKTLNLETFWFDASVSAQGVHHTALLRS